MKKLIAILATALCSICLNAQQFGNFEVRNFNLALGAEYLSFTYYDTNWNGLSLKYLAKPMEGFPKYEKGKFYVICRQTSLRGWTIWERCRKSLLSPAATLANCLQQ